MEKTTNCDQWFLHNIYKKQYIYTHIHVGSRYIDMCVCVFEACNFIWVELMYHGLSFLDIQDVEPEKFISAFSQHLKRQGRFELPKWADVVKTSKAKELPPSDPAAPVNGWVGNKMGDETF